jgi:hypothetical protein
MERAKATTSKLSHEEREALLIKGWMSHDARWFMAVAEASGLQAANRLNQVAAHGVGKVEALRLVRALGLPPVTELDDYLVLQEVLIGFLGPELIDYEVVQTDDETYEIQVQRCFAHENVTRAGVADSYECGIFARVTGWMEALGLRYEMTPSLGKCLKVEGRECAYAFKLKA